MSWPIGKKLVNRLQQALVRPLESHILRRFVRWVFLVGSRPGVVIVSGNVVPFGSPKTVSTALGRTLNVVAHEDDDLLFLNPGLLHIIQAGCDVGTIFLTAGDAGYNAAYWQDREAGTRAAYARMCRVANTWTQTDAGIPGHPIPVFTLRGHPFISLAFLRLPDGNIDGSGFPSNSHEGLQKLWTGSISTIHAVDGSSSYTKESLLRVLASLLSSFQPDQVNMQDYVGTFGDGDHSDHHASAYFVQSALQHYTTPHAFTGYNGYPTVSLAANVTGADLIAKRKAFYVYAQHDEYVCSSTWGCSRSSYGLWLQRQYTVGSGSGGTAFSSLASGDFDARQRGHVLRQSRS